MGKSREDYLPDLGGFLDGCSGDIIDARFDIASGDYADKVLLGGDGGKVPVVVTLTVDSPKFEKPVEQSYSVGSQEQWEIAVDGKSITNLKNQDKHTFRDGAIAMYLIKAMAEALGDGDAEKGQDVFVKRDHYMTEAAFYIGFSFDWEVKVITREINKRTITSKPPLPVKFLGMTSAKGEVKKTGKATVTAPSDTADLDQILIDNAAGKTDRELKSFAVRQPVIKDNDAYMKAVVSGKKLKELEDNGKLTMEPDTKTYL